MCKARGSMVGNDERVIDIETLPIGAERGYVDD